MYLKRVKMHREADTLIRGTGYEGNGEGRGCAIGCTLHEYNHEKYAKLIGVQVQVAHLIDWLFENLPSGHLEWPELVLTALKTGSDTSRVYQDWQVRLQGRNLERIGNGDEPWRLQCTEAVTAVRDLWAASGWPEPSAACSAESAERSAAWSAAWSAQSAACSAAWSAERSAAWSAERSAARSAERSAARSAAWSAESAACSAAWSAACSAAWSAERDKEIQQQADDLIELFAACKVRRAA
jgi:hypothetical protein